MTTAIELRREAEAGTLVAWAGMQKRAAEGVMGGYICNYSGGFVLTAQGEMALGGVHVVAYDAEGRRVEAAVHTIGM